MSYRTAGVAFVSLLLAGANLTRADAPSFQGLGVGTQVADLSGDGRVAVGSMNSLMAFKWQAGTLGFLTGSYGSSSAQLASQDGSVIVGKVVTGLPGEFVTQQVRWVNGVMTAMGGLSAYGSLRWAATSADGSVVVGTGFGGSLGNLCDALRWSGDGVQVLEGTSSALCMATDTTADGLSIVGIGSQGGFRWDNGTMSPVCIEPGDANTLMFGISNDGSIMIGCRGEMTSPFDPPPFAQAGTPSGSLVSTSTSGYYRWVNGVPEAIDEPPAGTPGAFSSLSVELSGDGSTIGYSLSPTGEVTDPNRVAEPVFALWRADTGWRDIEDILIHDCHLDITGWTLGEIKGISDDGLTLVGLGKNPSGEVESWIAHIPEPTSAALSLVAFTMLARRRKAEYEINS